MQPLQLLKAEFFRQQAVRYEPSVESMRVREDGVVCLGSLAGLSRSTAFLCHEMAHLVEIDDARCAKVGWGLRVRSVVILGRECFEPITHQCTDREIRVAAYQAVLQRHIGLSYDVRRITASFVHLPDWYNVPLDETERSDLRGLGSKYNERRASKLRWIVGQAETLRDACTFEWLYAEWKRKVDIISQRIAAAKEAHGQQEK